MNQPESFSVAVTVAVHVPRSMSAIRRFLRANTELSTAVGRLWPHTRYNPFLRFMMRLIASATGGSTDTSRDHEYTDWAAVDRFAGQQAMALEAHAAAA